MHYLIKGGLRKKKEKKQKMFCVLRNCYFYRVIRVSPHAQVDVTLKCAISTICVKYAGTTHLPVNM